MFLLFFLIIISNILPYVIDSIYKMSKQKPETLNVEQALKSKMNLCEVALGHKDFIIYALGIGFSQDPLKVDDFKYTYELDQTFTTFPTIASCFGQTQAARIVPQSNFVPHIELHTLLHGQQKLVMIHKKIHIGGTYRIKHQIIDIIDKGKSKGLLIVSRNKGFLINQKGQEDLAYYVERTTFLRTLGGIGFKGTGAKTEIPSIPKRNPDYVLKDKTFLNQALLYRVNSDPNPLHVDPNISAAGNFQRPILHGLATSGTVCRSIVQNLLNNDAQKLQIYEVRFTGHVYPGESLQIKVWKELNRYHFEVIDVQRKTKVLIGALTTRQQAKL